MIQCKQLSFAYCTHANVVIILFYSRFFFDALDVSVSVDSLVGDE